MLPARLKTVCQTLNLLHTQSPLYTGFSRREKIYLAHLSKSAQIDVKLGRYSRTLGALGHLDGILTEGKKHGDSVP